MTAHGSEWPRVTLVTPTYNQADFLPATIDSVLSQDYPNLEYIVLDDGSTDRTPEVMQHYAGRVRCERHENIGQARTLNRGWGLGSGELLGYLSSDDRLAPGAVSSLVEALACRPEAAAAYGDFDLIDAAGQPFRTVRAEDFDFERLAVDLVCQPGPGVLFRRSAFERIGGWSPQLRQVPDFEFWLRLAGVGTFVHVASVLAEYRVHEGSATFAVTSAERSDEIVGVMRDYWRHDPADRRGRLALARAHLLSAKSHAQSGRYRQGLGRWWQATALAPAMAFELSPWRALLSGLLRRRLHRLMGRAA